MFKTDHRKWRLIQSLFFFFLLFSLFLGVAVYLMLLLCFAVIFFQFHLLNSIQMLLIGALCKFELLQIASKYELIYFSCFFFSSLFSSLRFIYLWFLLLNIVWHKLIFVLLVSFFVFGPDSRSYAFKKCQMHIDRSHTKNGSLFIFIRFKWF